MIVIQEYLKLINQEKFLLWSLFSFILQNLKLGWNVIHLRDHFPAVQELDVPNLSRVHPGWVSNVINMDIEYLTIPKHVLGARHYYKVILFIALQFHAQYLGVFPPVFLLLELVLIKDLTMIDFLEGLWVKEADSTPAWHTVHLTFFKW